MFLLPSCAGSTRSLLPQHPLGEWGWAPGDETDPLAYGTLLGFVTRRFVCFESQVICQCRNSNFPVGSLGGFCSGKRNNFVILGICFSVSTILGAAVCPVIVLLGWSKKSCWFFSSVFYLSDGVTTSKLLTLQTGKISLFLFLRKEIFVYWWEWFSRDRKIMKWRDNKVPETRSYWI